MGGSARIATDRYVSSFFNYMSYLRPVRLQRHDPQCFESLNAMVSRWKTYLESGAFALAVPPETPLGGTAEVNDHVQFWTGPWAYWELQAKAPTLFRELQESQLVIFKVCDSYQESMSFVMLMSGQGDLKCARVSIFRGSRFVCFKC